MPYTPPKKTNLDAKDDLILLGVKKKQTLTQMSVVVDMNAAAVRKRVGWLEEKGLLTIKPRMKAGRRLTVLGEEYVNKNLGG